MSQPTHSHRLAALTAALRMPGDLDGLPQAQTAIAYATRMHADQQRGDGTPFILHPLEVASLLRAAGAPDHVTAAGALHDVLEKTEATPSELRRRFGARITRLVLAVTDDPEISGYARRKTALRCAVATAGDEALTIFAADKLSKVRELHREADLDALARPTRARQLRARRVRHYRRSLALLEERLPGSPLVRTFRDELHALLGDCAPLAGTR